jgi:beta-fructofuranosidase
MTIAGTKKLAIVGDRLELIAEFAKGTASSFGLNVRCSDDGLEKTVFLFDAEEEKIIVDRNQSGAGEGGIRKAKAGGGQTIKIHVFIDRSSVELFVNDGETVMTTRVYPKAGSNGIELFAEDGEAELLSLQAWELKDMWNSQ